MSVTLEHNSGIVQESKRRLASTGERLSLGAR